MFCILLPHGPIREQNENQIGGVKTNDVQLRTSFTKPTQKDGKDFRNIKGISSDPGKTIKKAQTKAQEKEITRDLQRMNSIVVPKQVYVYVPFEADNEKQRGDTSPKKLGENIIDYSDPNQSASHWVQAKNNQEIKSGMPRKIYHHISGANAFKNITFSENSRIYIHSHGNPVTDLVYQYYVKTTSAVPIEIVLNDMMKNESFKKLGKKGNFLDLRFALCHSAENNAGTKDKQLLKMFEYAVEHRNTTHITNIGVTAKEWAKKNGIETHLKGKDGELTANLTRKARNGVITETGQKKLIDI